MKLLIIQERGRNEANKEFRESCNLERSIKRQFHDWDVVVWGLGWKNFSISFNEMCNWCDVILLLENYDQKGWVPNLSNVNKLKLFWSIDSHIILQQHLNTCNYHKINIVLNSNPKDCPAFMDKNIGRKSYKFLSAYPHDLVFPLDRPKIYDIGFCGNVNNRGDYLQYINNNHGGKIDIMKIGADMVDCINSYKIHFNRNIAHEINGRTYETLGCQTFLLTNETYRLGEFFEIGKHLQVYTDFNDLSEKIQYYIDHENERNVIAKAGFIFAIENHSYDARCKELIQIITENI